MAWESKQNAQLDKEVRLRRDQVIKLLERHLETTTKAGNLDGALAILKEITNLSRPQNPNLPTDRVELVSHGQVWTGEHPVLGGKWSIELLAGGKTLLTHGRTQQRAWAFEHPNILYCWHPSQTITTGWKLTVDDSGITAKVETQGGGRGKAKLERTNGEQCGGAKGD